MLSSRRIDLSHIPTLFLVIGYPVYWLELYVFRSRSGVTTPLAVLLFVAAALVILWQERKTIAAFWQEMKAGFLALPLLSRTLITLGLIVSCIILGIAFWASLLPPHLVQESDALNYHLTLPRQHLIFNSFGHIPWAADDLFLLPIDFALAPYWFITELPNKLPQFLFLLGILGVAVNLSRRIIGNNVVVLSAIVLAILGSHNVGIQAGTAMLDLAICYLFLAAVDSFIDGRIGWAALEFSFFFWSKSFVPIQMTFIFVVLFVLSLILKKFGWKIFLSKLPAFKKSVIPFLIFSVFIGGPFMIKSWYYSGTPLFPFGVGKMMLNHHVDRTSPAWHSLSEASRIWLTEVKNKYGYGRSPIDFVKDFWRLAVPDHGVNNKFDYPLGLPYLLLAGPFLVLWIRSLFKREFNFVYFFIVLYWGSWWLGSQQSRFLFIPLMIIFIVTIPQLRLKSNVLPAVLVLAVILNAISVGRAHSHDWGRSRMDVLREKDKTIVRFNHEYLKENRHDAIPMPEHDVAYAQFPAMVVFEHLPHTIKIGM